MEYSGKVKEMLKGINVGDEVVVLSRGSEFKGILMPRGGSGKGIVVIKLKSGYNIGISPDSIKKIKSAKKPREKKIKIKEDPSKKTVVLLGAGGTIASKIDYRTGAVKPAMTPDEIIQFTPDIHNVANIKARLLFQMLSENITPAQWSTIAVAVKKEIDNGADGVVIMHGTDTMAYTSAYLSFALRDLGVPVILVGAQRSTDRASCDSHINLTCAVKAATLDLAGVYVCMHENISDESCILHEGTRVRKCHTSRRDAFKSIGVLPVARISYPSLKVKFLRSHPGRIASPVKLMSGFSDKVAFVKAYPGMTPSLLNSLKDFKGVVIEGTGLGHLPTQSYGDSWTKQNVEIFKALKDFRGIIFMTSQTIDGRVNMNVYETGRDLLKIGVLGNLQNILPETAYVKLVWALGNTSSLEEARKLMKTNIAGEFTERSTYMP